MTHDFHISAYCSMCCASPAEKCYLRPEHIKLCRRGDGELRTDLPKSDAGDKKPWRSSHGETVSEFLGDPSASDTDDALVEEIARIIDADGFRALDRTSIKFGAWVEGSPIEQRWRPVIAIARAILPILSRELAASKARIEELESENSMLAAGSCDVPDGKIGDEYGHFYCSLQAKLEAAEVEITFLRQLLHDVRLEASETIPPDGKAAAFAALHQIVRMITERAALAKWERANG